MNLAPTVSEGRNVRRAARSLIGALRQGDYLLENQVIDLSTVWWHGVRAAKVTEQSDGRIEFVPRNKRPTHAQVKALREAMAIRRRRGNKVWRTLAVELAAYSGVRRGELAVLDDTTVYGDGRIRVIWRLETIGGPHLALPKGNKRRWTTYPRGHTDRLPARRRHRSAPRRGCAGEGCRHQPPGLAVPVRTRHLAAR